ncbi:hypothetical protein Y032_0744g1998 [Ancylostoma ceylanicum]|uniref:Uncharacterized protein n=1 Tax=Ancylostoma ceylanicum TaxID=53326 RepID=A0A016WET2_9BILA|nr:hypothetical protein Y032_0744g1998 [Ancylostoma ceylanicum]
MPVYAATFGVRNPILFQCSRQYDEVKWLDERIFHSLVTKIWCHFLATFCKTALRKPGEQRGESTCHLLHGPNLALLDHNFSQVLVHFLVEKIFHFQHDVGNALCQLIATCFPGFQAVSATMLPVRWQGCAGNIGAYSDCSYPILLKKHYPKLSHSKSDISYLTT